MPDWAVFDDESLREGYTVVPNRLFRLRGLSPGAKYLYLHLLCLARQEMALTPRQVELMAALGVSRNTLRGWFEEMEAVRLLRRESRAGVLQTVVFLPLSEAGRSGGAPVPPEEPGGSDSDTMPTLSDSDGHQDLTGTPSESDRVPGGGPSESDRPPSMGRLDKNGQEDSKTAPPVSPPRGGAGLTGQNRAAQGRRGRGRLLTPEQHEIRQAGVDYLHTAIRRFTGLANPPQYSDQAAAGFFAERVRAGDSREDLIEGVDEYLARLAAKRRRAYVEGGRRITPHGSFAALKASWGSILQALVQRRLVQRRQEHAGTVRGAPAGAGRGNSEADRGRAPRAHVAGGVGRDVPAVAGAIARGVAPGGAGGEAAAEGGAGGDRQGVCSPSDREGVCPTGGADGERGPPGT